MAKPPGQSTVLLIDDESEILDGVATYLETAFPGMAVIKAPDGAAASRAMQRGMVDLVLADYRMPGRNGLEILLEAAQRMPHVPRVMFTAYPDLDVAIEALNQAKVRRFLVKPLEPATLKAVVQQLLEEPGDGRHQ